MSNPNHHTVVVTQVLHQAAASAIFTGRTAGGRLVRVVVQGRCHPAVGETYEVAGHEEDRREYGRIVRQIAASSAFRTRTSGALIMPWLQALSGVGPTRAKRLWEAFGNDLVDVLGDAERIDDIGKALEPSRIHLGRRLAERVHEAAVAKADEDDRAIAEARFRLRLEGLGVTDRQAADRLWRLIGSVDAEEKFLAVPYMAAALLSWERADHVGRRVLTGRGVEDVDQAPERLVGMCDATVRELLAWGDCAWPLDTILDRLKRKTGDRDMAWHAATLGHQAGAWIEGVEGLLRAPGTAWLEDDLATRFGQMIDGRQPSAVVLPNDLDHALERAEAATGMTLHEDQRGALRFLVERDLAVLQGGAGTGKTATMRVLVRLWEEAGGRVELCALAGKAALQLSRSTGRLARTVARFVAAFEQRLRLEDEGRGVDLPPDWPCLDAGTLLIVDEASMLDVGSWHRLVSLMPPGCRLLAVGDDGQLPPVGIGAIFHQLVKDARITARLSKIHRQGDGSSIPLCAAVIRVGALPQIEPYTGPRPGVSIIECRSPNAALDAVEQVAVDLGGHHGDSSLMICAALRSTVDEINDRFANRKKVSMPTVLAAPGVRVSPGDPVVCTRNRYDLGLMNGSLGHVIEVSPEDGGAVVHWDGDKAPVLMPADALRDVALAYAITAHRAQGSAATRVIVPIEANRIVTRQWLYTAVTRAVEQVVLVGPRDHLQTALARETKRQTGFRLY
ncbi:MAG: AAA family ATPase [Magnetospirillum gryphiswaldense]|nr:AAA family ATPase [Magnetospirillum gryphiswaldense]